MSCIDFKAKKTLWELKSNKSILFIPNHKVLENFKDFFKCQMVLSFLSVSCRQIRESEVDLWLISGQIWSYKLIKKFSRPTSSLRRCATTNRRDPASIWLVRGSWQTSDEATHRCSRGGSVALGRCRGRRAAAPVSTRRDRSSPDFPQTAGWRYSTQSGTKSVRQRDTGGGRERLWDSIKLSFAKHVSHRISF